MTSPYSTRYRKQGIDHNLQEDLKGNNRPRYTSSSNQTSLAQNNKICKVQTVHKGHHEESQSTLKKAEGSIEEKNQKEFSNTHFHTSSIQQPLHVKRKSRKPIIECEPIEQNILNMSSDLSDAISIQQIDKENEKFQSKIDNDIQNYQERKSYRKLNSSTCLGVPYRKCHSTMQQKVVSIINKIKSGKQCHKQIETLIDRTKKVSIKQLNNKYFVSGIQLLFNFSLQKQYKDTFNEALRNKITFCLDDLKTKILMELDNTKGFEAKQIEQQETEDRKVELVKRIYRILRRKLRNIKREEVQSEALKTADRFIKNKCNDLHVLYEELALK